MTIIKISKSGKQIQVIDDFGNIYGTSLTGLQNLLNGQVRQGYVMLMRMPFNVSANRFGVSPLWEIPGQESTNLVKQGDSSVNLSNDAFSASNIKKKEDIKKFQDKVVW